MVNQGCEFSQLSLQKNSVRVADRGSPCWALRTGMQLLPMQSANLCQNLRVISVQRVGETPCATAQRSDGGNVRVVRRPAPKYQDSKSLIKPLGDRSKCRRGAAVASVND